jgi:hypothetical protein
MTHTSVVETNMQASGTSQVYVDFTAGAADAAGTLSVAFPAGFTVGASGSQTASTATCVAFFGGSTLVLPGSSASASSSGTTLSDAYSSALTSGSNYCVEFTYASAVTNNSSAGNYNTTITAGTDTQTQGIDILSGTTNQIAVSASIAQFFTMSLGNNTDTITGASPATYAVSSGVTVSLSTNAASGWGLWAADGTHSGLYSTSTTHNIPAITGTLNFSTPTTSEGTEKYGINVTAVTGTGVAATTNYNGVTNNYNGGGVSNTTYNEIASTTSSGAGTAKVGEVLDVASSTPNATDYADTIRLVGDGSF